MRVLILNGPNLSRLGTREPAVYGTGTYPELQQACELEAGVLGLQVEVRQSDSEPQLIEWLASAGGNFNAVILNAGALTHYSHDLAQACAALSIPLIEVHLSNPHAREPFRSRSVLSAHALGVICGFGIDSYILALKALASRLGR